MTGVAEFVARRGGGRPPIRFDNRRVHRFLNLFESSLEVYETHPRIDDVMEGVIHLQTDGEAHTRPLSRFTLYGVLHGCEVIDTGEVGRVLEKLPKAGKSTSTVARYAAAARVSAKAIVRLLDANPKWELIPDWKGYEAPYLAELRASGLY